MYTAYVELADGTVLGSFFKGTSEEAYEVARRIAHSCNRNGMDVLCFRSKKI